MFHPITTLSSLLLLLLSLLYYHHFLSVSFFKPSTWSSPQRRILPFFVVISGIWGVAATSSNTPATEETPSFSSDAKKGLDRVLSLIVGFRVEVLLLLLLCFVIILFVLFALYMLYGAYREIKLKFTDVENQLKQLNSSTSSTLSDQQPGRSEGRNSYNEKMPSPSSKPFTFNRWRKKPSIVGLVDINEQRNNKEEDSPMGDDSIIVLSPLPDSFNIEEVSGVPQDEIIAEPPPSYQSRFSPMGRINTYSPAPGEDIAEGEEEESLVASSNPLKKLPSSKALPPPAKSALKKSTGNPTQKTVKWNTVIQETSEINNSSSVVGGDKS